VNSRRAVRAEAPAKVNLYLRVLHRRPDGFHELETLFQAVALSDRLLVTRGGVGVTLRVDGPDLGPVEDNLVHRAASAFLARGGLAGEGVEIDLEKRIPAGGGLGGGSSDAAATLRCMDALWPGAVPSAALREVAASLGSDVPFFLGSSGLALGRGRGERLESLPPLPTRWLVLVLPPVHVATGSAYAALARPLEGEAALPDGGWPPPGWVPSWTDVEARAVNDFQAVVPAAHPAVAASLQALEQAGARPALLSGSGAACFGLFSGKAEAEEAARETRVALGWPALAVPTLARLPGPQDA